MNDTKIKFSDLLMPGVIISLVMIALSLILQYTIPDLEIRQKFGYITFAISLGLILYYGIQFRNSMGDSGLEYGMAFKYFFYLLLFISVIMMVFSYINYTFIDPDLVDQLKEIAADEVYNNPDIPEEQIEKVIEMQQKFMSPGWMIVWMGFTYLIFSVIVALIGAIFIKKNPTIIIED